MARKVSVSKEKILEAALKMLIRDGYAAINIKTLAAEAGCSTQPIAWHFKNMEGLRKELAMYAFEYSRKKISPAGNAVEDFERMGEAYIRMAAEEPSLFRFLYLGESPVSKPYVTGDLPVNTGDREMAEKIAAQTGLSADGAVRCIQNTVIYSHGLATMIATGVLKASVEEIMAMIKNASKSFVLKERMKADE